MTASPRSILAFVFCAILCSLFISCDSSLLYQQKHENETGIWAEQSYDFDVAITDTTMSYNLVLAVEHADDFYYQNLYTRFSTRYPSGKENSDVVSLELSSKVGQWHGDCSGGRCNTPILLQNNIHFKELGKHQISISQHSRKPQVEGVYSLELQLRKAI